ncbi:hypothetical protein MCHI_003689 [Candidatus Magnetoovum chiemensis]|nr:hypothetical protein MCHI_003689 [Candidatus Magnetoovum chiemensis]
MGINNFTRLYFLNKNYKIDILTITVILLANFYLFKINTHITVENKSERVTVEKKEELELLKSALDSSYNITLEKNMFSPNHEYPAVKPAQQPKEPEKKINYLLLGVIISDNAKALLKDDNGNLYYVKEGDELPDKSKVNINNEKTVFLEKNGEKIKLEIFLKGK